MVLIKQSAVIIEDTSSSGSDTVERAIASNEEKIASEIGTVK